MHKLDLGPMYILLSLAAIAFVAYAVHIIWRTIPIWRMLRKLDVLNKEVDRGWLKGFFRQRDPAVFEHMMTSTRNKSDLPMTWLDTPHALYVCGHKLRETMGLTRASIRVHALGTHRPVCTMMFARRYLKGCMARVKGTVLSIYELGGIAKVFINDSYLGAYCRIAPKGVSYDDNTLLNHEGHVLATLNSTDWRVRITLDDGAEFTVYLSSGKNRYSMFESDGALSDRGWSREDRHVLYLCVLYNLAEKWSRAM